MHLYISVWRNSKATTASIAEVVANKNSNNKSGVQGKNTEPKDKQDNAQKDGEKEKIDKDKLVRFDIFYGFAYLLLLMCKGISCPTGVFLVIFVYEY